MEKDHSSPSLPERAAQVFFYCISDGTPVRSLKVAAVVGTALNLINQGEAIFGSSSINWLKRALTFAMPYLVSTYGAVSFRMANERVRHATHQDR